MVVYNLKQVESLWFKKLQELSFLQDQCVTVQGSLDEARGAVRKLEGELKESRCDNSLLKVCFLTIANFMMCMFVPCI